MPWPRGPPPGRPPGRATATGLWVGSDTDWAKVTAGEEFSCAVKTTGVPKKTVESRIANLEKRAQEPATPPGTGPTSPKYAAPSG